MNRIQRNLTGSKISMSSTKFVFFGPVGNKDGRPGLWLAEIFSTSHLKSLNGIQRNLTGSKISMSSTKFVFFGSIGKTRWPPQPLIGWHILDFSDTAERNSTKVDRKQDLNALYQVCVIRADRKKDGRPGLWLAETFSTSSLKSLNGIQRNLTGSKISMSSTKFVIFGPIGKTRWPPWPLIGWDILDFFSETAERNSTNLDRKQDLIALYQVCVFRANRKNKMAALASDWLRNFRLLLWNRWSEFNETWQEARSQRPLQSLCFSGQSEKKMAALASDWLRHFRLLLCNRWTEFNEPWQDARSQCPLPSLCFSGRSVKQYSRPGLWLAETFSTSSLKPLNGIQRNLTGSKVSMSSTKLVFFGPIGKTRWPPWPLNGWDIFDFFSETAERNSTKLDRKQDLIALYQVCGFGADRKKQNGRPGLWLAETFSTSPLKRLKGIQRNLTGIKISTPSTEFVFFEPIGKQDGGPGLWLAETFSTSLMEPLNGIQRLLTGSKISKSSTKFVFFGLIGKARWPPQPLIGWDIFDFSKTAERNSAKLDRK